MTYHVFDAVLLLMSILISGLGLVSVPPGGDEIPSNHVMQPSILYVRRASVAGSSIHMSHIPPTGMTCVPFVSVYRVISCRHVGLAKTATCTCSILSMLP